MASDKSKTFEEEVEGLKYANNMLLVTLKEAEGFITIVEKTR